MPPGWQARVRSALPVFLVLGLIAGMLGPWREPITQRLEAARKRLAPRYENVYPAKVEASTALPDHPAPAAADRAPNTYWAEDGPTNGENEGLIFTFDRPVDLGRIGFYNGAQTKPQDFLAQPRLRDVLITFDDDDQRTSLTLKDDDAFQSYEIEAKQVTTLIVLIESVYLSPQGGTAASIGEVEFFTKH